MAAKDNNVRNITWKIAYIVPSIFRSLKNTDEVLLSRLILQTYVIMFSYRNE